MSKHSARVSNTVAVKTDAEPGSPNVISAMVIYKHHSHGQVMFEHRAIVEQVSTGNYTCWRQSEAGIGDDWAEVFSTSISEHRAKQWLEGI